MPVPCKRNLGLADDAATTAKRMQNGAAVEANLSSTLGQSGADGWPMIAIIPANPPPCPVRKWPQALEMICPADQLPRQRLATPSGARAAIFATQATDTPQMRLDVDPTRSVKGAHACGHDPGYHFLSRSLSNSAAFHQTSLPAEIHAMHADVEPAGAVSDRISARKARKNPVLERDQVSMPAKICGH